MAELIIFLESDKEIQTYECPDMPEAPQGSIFHRNFDISTLKIKLTGDILEFLNPDDDEIVVVAKIEKNHYKINASFTITELAIRSYQVFKNIDLSIKSSDKFSIGVECNGKKADYSF